jgi:uncharacterized protein (TIGR02996 family)
MHEAFLREVQAHPDDDTPRLVYADWLDDQAGPLEMARAEFIRTQCELARLPLDDERRPGLEARERQLLAGRHKTWAGPLREDVNSYVFRRGFVEEVRLSAGAFLARAERLFEWAPLRSAHLVDVAAKAKELADSPYLARLRGLRLTVEGRPAYMVPAGSDAAGVLTTLLRSRHLKDLRSLALPGNNLGTAGAGALAKAAALAGLAELDLRHASMGADGLEALARAPTLSRLRKLRLGGQTAPTNAAARAAAARNFGRAAALFLDRLEELDLRWNGAAADTVLPLENVSGPVPLRVLRLRGAAVDVAALASSPRLPGLVSLSLRGCALQSEGLRALLRGPALSRLCALDLGDSGVEQPALEALASSPHLGRLARLGLAANRAAGGGLPALAEAAIDGRLPRLAELDLSHTKLGEEALRLLARSPLREQFTSLDLSHTTFSAAGPLLEADWPRLTWLDLRGNPLGRAAQAALRARFGHAVRYGAVPRR